MTNPDNKNNKFVPKEKNKTKQKKKKKKKPHNLFLFKIETEPNNKRVSILSTKMTIYKHRYRYYIQYLKWVWSDQLGFPVPLPSSSWS